MACNELYYKIQNDIYGRVNVLMRKSPYGQAIVLYEDHRWLLNVLFALRKYIERPNLVYFDAHDDAAPCEDKSMLLNKIGVNDLSEATPKQFSAFVDYDQDIDDGGWLTTAMELDLVGDVVNIGNRNNSNIQDFNGLFKSEDGGVHNVFELCGNLEYELGNRGKLGDAFKVKEYRDIRDFFGIAKSYDDTYSLSLKNDFVLDFDLDYFTISISDDGTHGWTERIFNKKYPWGSKQNRFLRYLIEKSSVITICREPGCCGSIGDSNRILNILDRYYFEGRLGTEVTL